MSDIDIPKCFIPFLQTPKRYKILFGGRGSGKSRFFALASCMKAAQGKKVVCGREFQGSLKESVHELITTTINQYGLPGFTIHKSEVTHASGGRMIFIGLARNPDSARSLEGASVCWIEEAQFLSIETIRTLAPSIRGEDSEIWLSGNPKRLEDPFSQEYIEAPLTKGDYFDYDDMHMRLHVNYDVNPFFPIVLEQERLKDFRNLDRAMYDHVWRGHYNDSVDNSIIKSEWIDAAVDLHIKQKWDKFGQIITSHDPADNGDARATAVKHGNIILATYEDHKNDINAACAKSLEMARLYNSNAFVYDSDGCGLGLRAQVHDFWDGRADVYQFRGGTLPARPDVSIGTNAAGRPILNRQFYRNLRAQCYHALAKRFEATYLAVEGGKYTDPHTLISLSSKRCDVTRIRSELTSIARVYNNSGTYQVMSKEEMKKKLKVKSPNLADALMMLEINLSKGSKWVKGQTISPKGGIV